ncbi:MAG: 2-amino-4-hydroxy-6-hydroxymethyldihydropteridine diphosphokinase [Bacteroidota bacterium]
MNKAYLGIGGNLGDRQANLGTAISYIKAEIGIITSISSIYQTKAWGIENQPDFLNQCLVAETKLSPEEVLRTALAIEQKMGRVREQKWYTRIIDIDLLFYNQLIINTKKLIIPHPHLHQRNFVLAPMAEIAPDFVHPILQKNIAQLYRECEDKLPVDKLVFTKFKSGRNRQLTTDN